MLLLISCLAIFVIKKRVFCLSLGVGGGCPLDFGKRDVTSSTGEMLSMFPCRGNAVTAYITFIDYIDQMIENRSNTPGLLPLPQAIFTRKYKISSQP